jgi:hypothetical protein
MVAQAAHHPAVDPGAGGIFPGGKMGSGAQVRGAVGGHGTGGEEGGDTKKTGDHEASGKVGIGPPLEGRKGAIGVRLGGEHRPKPAGGL